MSFYCRYAYSAQSAMSSEDLLSIATDTHFLARTILRLHGMGARVKLRRPWRATPLSPLPEVGFHVYNVFFSSMVQMASCTDHPLRLKRLFAKPHSHLPLCQQDNSPERKNKQAYKSPNKGAFLFPLSFAVFIS